MKKPVDITHELVPLADDIDDDNHWVFDRITGKRVPPSAVETPKPVPPENTQG